MIPVHHQGLTATGILLLGRELESLSGDCPLARGSWGDGRWVREAG